MGSIFWLQYYSLSHAFHNQRHLELDNLLSKKAPNKYKDKTIIYIICIGGGALF